MKRCMLKWLPVVLLCALLVACLAGCNIMSPTSIEVIDGSIPSEYNVDAAFPGTAKISVKYGEIMTKQVEIDRSYVSGFDTSISGADKTMTITYKGISTTKSYAVRGDVNTKARLAAEYNTNGTVVEITLKLSSLDIEGGGLYAIKAVMEFDSGVITVDEVVGTVDGWTLKSDSAGDSRKSSLTMLYYDATAAKKLTEDGSIIKIKVTKAYQSANVRLLFRGAGDNGCIEMSDGNGAKYLPQAEITV